MYLDGTNPFIYVIVFFVIFCVFRCPGVAFTIPFSSSKALGLASSVWARMFDQTNIHDVMENGLAAPRPLIPFGSAFWALLFVAGKGVIFRSC
jgi:hypothetical protein